jgi:hypothetical protein
MEGRQRKLPFNDQCSQRGAALSFLPLSAPFAETKIENKPKLEGEMF